MICGFVDTPPHLHADHEELRKSLFSPVLSTTPLVAAPLRALALGGTVWQKEVLRCTAPDCQVTIIPVSAHGSLRLSVLEPTRGGGLTTVCTSLEEGESHRGWLRNCS